MAISSPGIGSGLDINGIISKLMQVEQQPLIALARKEASYQSKISALGSLQSALSSLKTAASAMVPSTGQTAAAKYTSYSATVADSTIASASASTGAVAGAYSLEVTSLAKSHQLMSAAYLSGETTVVGAVGETIVIERGSVSGGIFTGKTGTSPITITIDDTNKTLAGIRDAINAAKAGVTATIVTGDTGAQLVLTGDSPGTKDIIRTTGTLAAMNYNPVDQSGSLTQKQPATDAVIKLNGVTVTKQSNTITDALTGVSLTLAKETTSATTVTVSKNTTSTLTASFAALAKAYNDLAKAMNELGSYDAETQKGGPLLGNTTLRSVESRMRRVLGEVPAGATGTYTRLAQVGITLQRDGTMAVDSSKLQTAATADFESVTSLASALGSALKSATDSMVGTGGTIPSATAGLNASINDINDRREAFALRLTQVEARYRKQFTALDTMISSMNSTSAYLTQQLASLSSFTTSSN